MKIAKVVGKLSLHKCHPALLGRKWIVVVPQTLSEIAGRPGNRQEEFIAADDLGVTPGSLVGVSEGREACAPYEPQRKPVDAYTSCLLDELTVDEKEIAKLLNP